MKKVIALSALAIATLLVVGIAANTWFFDYTIKHSFVKKIL